MKGYGKSKRRYFVLKGTQLSYYKDEDADVPKGTIQLCFQSTKSCLEKTSETAFRVVTDDGGKLTAQSFDEENLNMWMDALQSIVDDQRKASPSSALGTPSSETVSPPANKPAAAAAAAAAADEPAKTASADAPPPRPESATAPASSDKDADTGPANDDGKSALTKEAEAPANIDEKIPLLPVSANKEDDSAHKAPAKKKHGKRSTRRHRAQPLHNLIDNALKAHKPPPGSRPATEAPGHAEQPTTLTSNEEAMDRAVVTRRKRRRPRRKRFAFDEASASIAKGSAASAAKGSSAAPKGSVAAAKAAHPAKEDKATRNNKATRNDKATRTSSPSSHDVASEGAKPAFTGWLTKKPINGIGASHQRYFVLRRDAKMHYFTDETRIKEKGVVEVDAVKDTSGLSMEVHTNRGNMKLAALDASTKREWLQVFASVLSPDQQPNDAASAAPEPSSTTTTSPTTTTTTTTNTTTTTTTTTTTAAEPATTEGSAPSQRESGSTSTGSNVVLHQGWLRKRPRGRVGTSKDRFFVLTKDSLRYYQDEARTSIKGRIPLSLSKRYRCCLQPKSESEFVVSEGGGPGGQILLEVQALTDEEARAWLGAFHGRNSLTGAWQEQLLGCQHHTCMPLVPYTPGPQNEKAYLKGWVCDACTRRSDKEGPYYAAERYHCGACGVDFCLDCATDVPYCQAVIAGVVSTSKATTPTATTTTTTAPPVAADTTASPPEPSSPGGAPPSASANPLSPRTKLRDAVDTALTEAEQSPRLATWFDKKAVHRFGKKQKRFVELNTIGAEIRYYTNETRGVLKGTFELIPGTVVSRAPPHSLDIRRPDGLHFSAEILSHDEGELDVWVRTLKEVVNSNSPMPASSAGKRGKSRSRVDKST